MKKILIIFTFLIAICSCNNIKKSYTIYSREEIENAKRYEFIDNPDTLNFYKLNATILQTLNKNEALLKDDNWNHYLYIDTNEPLYDNKEIKTNVIFIGTYSYINRLNVPCCVPIYCTSQTYRIILDNGTIELINDMKNSE